MKPLREGKDLQEGRKPRTEPYRRPLCAYCAGGRSDPFDPERWCESCDGTGYDPRLPV